MKDAILQDIEAMEEIMAKTSQRCDIWQDRYIYHIAKAIYHILLYIRKQSLSENK